MDYFFYENKCRCISMGSSLSAARNSMTLCFVNTIMMLLCLIYANLLINEIKNQWILKGTLKQGMDGLRTLQVGWLRQILKLYINSLTTDFYYDRQTQSVGTILSWSSFHELRLILIAYLYYLFGWPWCFLSAQQASFNIMLYHDDDIDISTSRIINSMLVKFAWSNISSLVIQFLYKIRMEISGWDQYQSWTVALFLGFSFFDIGLLGSLQILGGHWHTNEILFAAYSSNSFCEVSFDCIIVPFLWSEIWCFCNIEITYTSGCMRMRCGYTCGWRGQSTGLMSPNRCKMMVNFQRLVREDFIISWEMFIQLQITYKIILIITSAILKWISINELVKIVSIKTKILS